MAKSKKTRSSTPKTGPRQRVSTISVREVDPAFGTIQAGEVLFYGDETDGWHGDFESYLPFITEFHVNPTKGRWAWEVCLNGETHESGAALTWHEAMAASAVVFQRIEKVVYLTVTSQEPEKLLEVGRLISKVVQGRSKRSAEALAD